MSLTGTASLNLDLLHTSTTNTIGLVSERIPSKANQPATLIFTDGTGSNQVQKVYSISGSLTNTTASYDLTNLAGSTGTVTFSAIKMVYVQNKATDGSTLLVGNAPTNAFPGPLSSGATLTVNSSGQTFNVAPLTGWTVDSSHKNLLLTAVGTVSYDLLLVGV